MSFNLRGSEEQIRGGALSAALHPGWNKAAPCITRARRGSALHAPQPQLRPAASLHGAGGVGVSCVGNEGLHPASTCSDFSGV